MLIQQTHFPQSGPNWVNIGLISAGLIVTGIIIYQITKPSKIIMKLKHESEKKPDGNDSELGS